MFPFGTGLISRYVILLQQCRNPSPSSPVTIIPCIATRRAVQAILMTIILMTIMAMITTGIRTAITFMTSRPPGLPRFAFPC